MISRHRLPVALDEAEERVEAAQHPLVGRQVRRGRLREVLQQLPVGEQQQLLVQLLLALEVPVQQAGGDLRHVGDLLDPRALVAALGEHLRGGLEQLLPAHLRLQTLALRSFGHVAEYTCAPTRLRCEARLRRLSCVA